MTGSHVHNAKAIAMKNTIYCGDNLAGLGYLPSRFVDLVYVDPPLSGSADSSLTESPFENTTDSSEKPKPIGENTDEWPDGLDLYLNFLRERLLEIRRVMKPTASLYLHSDAGASGYVRVMLDDVFGADNYRSQIIWKYRQTWHSAKRTLPNTYEVIYFYTKSTEYAFEQPRSSVREQDYSDSYRYVEEGTGRRFRLVDLTSRPSDRPAQTYEFLGVRRSWKFSKERMKDALEEGRIVQTREGSVPAMKQYLDEQEERPLGDVWLDISPLSPRSDEPLGLPTQKPLELLERILKMSSKKDDTILDPFCGSGTALHAAQSLGRQWIGIDISPVACRVSAQRLSKHFGYVEGDDFLVKSLRMSEDELRRMEPVEFEQWVINALHELRSARSRKSSDINLPDFAISAYAYPVKSPTALEEAADALVSFGSAILAVEVKQRGKVRADDIKQLEASMKHQEQRQGVVVAFDFTRDALRAIERISSQGDMRLAAIRVNQLRREVNKQLPAGK